MGPYDVFEEQEEPEDSLGGVNHALVGVVIFNLRQVRVKNGPFTLDKDGLGTRFAMEVSTPSVAPHEVIKLSHAFTDACPFEDVKTI
jgi:hypothetical protein